MIIVFKKKKDDFICHHGILGQKWGVRRYQNEDGSLTPEGEKRYAKDLKYMTSVQKYTKATNKAAKQLSKVVDLQVKTTNAWKKTGKNIFERNKNIKEGKSNEVKEYLKLKSKTLKYSKIADKTFDDAMAMYVSTGENFVDRIINNKNYGKIN